MKNNRKSIERNEGKNITDEVYRIPFGIKITERSSFRKNASIRKIIFPITINEIRANSFGDCTSLEEVKLPKGFSLKKIGSYAFEGCKNLKEIEIPNSVQELEYGVFWGCTNLKRAVLPAGLKYLEHNTFALCKSLEEITFPKKLKRIMTTAFESCESLKTLNFRGSLKAIEYGAFRNCSSLENVTLPESIEVLGQEVFMGCTSLKKIRIPNKIFELASGMFKNCTALDEVVLPNKMMTIHSYAFEGCTALESFEFPARLERIGIQAFRDCSNLKEIKIPESVYSLEVGAFENCSSLEKINIPSKVLVLSAIIFKGCKSLKEINIPASIEAIGNNAFNGCISLKRLDLPANITLDREIFAGCTALEEVTIKGYAKNMAKNVFYGTDFRYVYKLKNSENIVYSKYLPENVGEIENIVEISEIEKKLEGFDIGQLALKGNFERYAKAVEKLEIAKVYIPVLVLEKLMEVNKLEEIGKTLNFKFFKGEIPNIREIIKKYNASDVEVSNLYKFAMGLGCFSTEKLVDKMGNPTNIARGQKATSFIAALLKGDAFKKINFSILFNRMSYNDKFPQSFLNFITHRADGKTYNNWEMLVRLEYKHPGIALKVAKNFDQVESQRVALDSTGRPQNLSWEEAIVRYYTRNLYEDIAEETRGIADLFLDKGIEESVYNEAIKIHRKAKQKGIRAHILDVHLREETILETIEKVKKSIDETLIGDKTLIEELYEKKFTYEFLSKHDPHNSIMGIFCSCCGTITSSYYGKDIAKASIIAPNVQNLVVRDAKGDIIAKGTMYVDPSGYAVINDFEINEKYKKHEEWSDGYYKGGKTSKEEQERDLIFKAFMRGIHAFVEEYDKEHPNAPLKKVNVGMGYNRLKLQCSRYREETKLLKVPASYKFMDAQDSQWVLYERGKNTEISEEQSR